MESEIDVACGLTHSSFRGKEIRMAEEESGIINVDVSEANNNQSESMEDFTIGEPESEDFDIHASVCFSHRYFRKVPGTETAVCLTCQRANAKKGPRDVKKKDTFSTAGGSTAGCRSHLVSKHKGPLLDKYLETDTKVEKLRAGAAEKLLAAKKKKETIGQSKLSFKNGQLSMSQCHDPQMQSRWDEAVVLYTSETFTSFRAAAKMDILLRAIWPSGRFKIQVRSNVTVGKHVSMTAETLRSELYPIIAAETEEGGAVAFTSDIWTNKTRESFMSLTAHKINKDFDYLRFCPFVNFMDEKKHTGQNIAIKFDNFLRKLNLDGPDIRKYVVLDNAPNNKKFARLSADKVESLWCVCHTLALVITDLFKMIVGGHTQIKEVLEKCQKVAVFIHRSENNEVTLKKACEDTETPYHVPVLAIKTRWNSSYDNVESNLKLEKPLRQLSDSDTSSKQVWRKKVLSPLEYEAAKGMNKALRALKVATKIFESDTEPTVHKVIPELFEISDQLERLTKEGGLVSEMADLLQSSFVERFPECLVRVKLYAVAHFLDPANKGCVLEVYRDAYEEARQELLKMLKLYDKTPPPTLADNPLAETDEDLEEDSNLSAVERLRKRRRVSGDQEESQARTRSIPAPELEIQTFEKLQINPEDAKNSLKWWKAHSNQFPLMSRAVRETYCVPAASSASERAFSMGSLICTQRRGHLTPKKIEELAIIKLNYSAVKSFKEKYGGIPKMNVTPPDNDDFELEEISDNEEELDDFDIDYEELTGDEDGQD